MIRGIPTGTLRTSRNHRPCSNDSCLKPIRVGEEYVYIRQWNNLLGRSVEKHYHYHCRPFRGN